MIDSVEDRAAVEANPGLWVEIPKNIRIEGEREDADTFIRRFLAENGIETSWK
jgi:hypothetical protein